ncbi:aminotransferase class V-fold PLP-dependent enzyme [Salinibius halmophilus]|uniref:aminotransferase class V-fold PLP-dependent enzyme n=1 Tax=Salinibius halmophilus TaxID=1853216 RepID=UPI000E66A27F|nr:aminotransferase class V-fold PLP-dependent enzyme [Salinibius halmophilus]
MFPTYFDFAATTPVDPKVAQAMAECLTLEGTFANPASRSHMFGWFAEEKVETARNQVAELVGADSREIVWTSGATESNNLALKGVFEKHGFSGHLITSATEHKAVLDVAAWLEKHGVHVTYLLPNEHGFIDAGQVADAIQADTRMVSIMHVNNETGAVNDIPEIGALLADKEIIFHVDGAQSIAKVAVNVEALKIDLLSISAHKFYGPKGVGALYVRRAVKEQLVAQIHGGGHERGLRSGTLATHQLVGMGLACELATDVIAEGQRIGALRDQLWQGIRDLPNVRSNVALQYCSPNHLNVCFSGVDGETLLLALNEVAISTGSACTSASVEPSYVLKAMGLSNDDAHSSLRISLGRFTTEGEVKAAVAHIKKTVKALQSAA